MPLRRTWPYIHVKHLRLTSASVGVIPDPLQPPTGFKWRLDILGCHITTDAIAGDRSLYFSVLTAGVGLWYSTPLTIPPSSERDYHATKDAQQETPVERAPNHYIVALPVDFWVTHDCNIYAACTNLGIADTLTLSAWVKEQLEYL